MTQAIRPTDEQLSAWLDHALDPAEHSAVDAWLRDHPEDAALTRLWAADRDALRARLDPVLDEPLPAALLQALQPQDPANPAAAISAAASPAAAIPAAAVPAAATTAAANQATWRRAALATGLLLGGGLLGGLIGAAAVSRDPVAFASLPLPWRPVAMVAASWPHRAAVAHAVYAPEVRHPVEVNVAQGSAAEQRAQEDHLARWLGKRLGQPVRLYDLRPLGFELVGGRLLPDLAGPSAQLMYQDSSGLRITLYLRRPDAGASVAFKFQRDGELNLFYWVEDGFGCALVGKLPRAQLLALAEAVYKQSEADISPASRPAPAPPGQLAPGPKPAPS